MADPRVVPALAVDQPDRWAAVGRWFLGLGAVVFLAAIPVKLSFQNVGFISMIVGAVLVRARLWRHPGFVIACGFAAWQALSAVVSPYPDPIHRWGMAYNWLAFYLCATAFADSRWPRWGLKLMAVTCVLVLVLALIQFTVGLDRGAKPWRVSADGERFDYPVGLHHWNLTLGFQVVLAGLLLWYAGARCGLSRWWRLSGLLAALATAALAQCRSAFVGLAAGVVTASASRGWRRLLIVSVGLVLIAGLGLLTMVLANPEKVERMRRLEDGRRYIWPVSLGIVNDHPAFGVGGARAFKPVYKERFATAYPDQTPEFANGAPHAHNSFISIAAEHGLPALLLYLAWIGAILLFLWRRRDASPEAWSLGVAAVAFAFAAGMFENYAGDSEAAYALHAALGLAVAIALRRSADVARPALVAATPEPTTDEYHGDDDE